MPEIVTSCYFHWDVVQFELCYGIDTFAAIPLTTTTSCAEQGGILWRLTASDVVIPLDNTELFDDAYYDDDTYVADDYQARVGNGRFGETVRGDEVRQAGTSGTPPPTSPAGSGKQVKSGLVDYDAGADRADYVLPGDQQNALQLENTLGGDQQEDIQPPRNIRPGNMADSRHHYIYDYDDGEEPTIDPFADYYEYGEVLEWN
ncbi:hypothetical protein CYMTET_9090 [Cymbomonas tetramitiformis]|uniref:Uncharacterized protein n=1 Tax=Cymbomonas tetramitiformis TaxID=36881 RepID=A0AAE0LFD6_9CHLO|nr:hypothetical protein CYMTET_9090 [Cymbomonas tetramitiformis]